MKPGSKTERVRLLAIGVAMLLPAGPVVTATANGPGSVLAALPDPMALFALRSAGARDAGVLVQSKMPYAPADTPADDFLGLISEPDLPPAGGALPPVSPFATGPFPEEPPLRDLTALLLPPGSDNSGGPGLFAAGPGGGIGDGFVVGGGGFAAGGAGPFRAASPALAEPLAPSPVPEPGSWLMMLTGFLVIGGALRSRRRAEATSSGDAMGRPPAGGR